MNIFTKKYIIVRVPKDTSDYYISDSGSLFGNRNKIDTQLSMDVDLRYSEIIGNTNDNPKLVSKIPKSNYSTKNNYVIMTKENQLSNLKSFDRFINESKESDFKDLDWKKLGSKLKVKKDFIIKIKQELKKSDIIEYIDTLNTAVRNSNDDKLINDLMKIQKFLLK